VDKVAWAMHDEPRVSCVGVGGRMFPNEGGNIYDHFEGEYLYANGVRAFVANRQIVGCYNENSDYIMGTEGTCTIGRGPVPRIEGKTNWTFTGKQYDMYQKEHDEMFAAIRKNQPINNGKRMATSTLLAIMGRLAAYTGQQVTWDQAMNSQWKLVPDKVDWNGSHPVDPIAQPGITKLV
jgi:myo-inositol 2-dehydrogenase/D-chiro-inositol 1-dehydrogenase